MTDIQDGEEEYNPGSLGMRKGRLPRRPFGSEVVDRTDHPLSELNRWRNIAGKISYVGRTFLIGVHLR